MSTDWFYSDGDRRLGPVPEDELKRLVQNGTIRANDLVWKDGMADWVEARSIKELIAAPDPTPVSDEPPPRRRRFDGDGSVESQHDVDEPPRRARGRDRDEPKRRDQDEDEGFFDGPRSRDWDRDDQHKRRSYEDDDYYDRPRRPKRYEKPGQVQAVGIMMLVGGILATLFGLGLLFYSGIIAIGTMGFGLLCCLWPGTYLELTAGIMGIIRGINMLNKDDQGPPKTVAVLQILCIINGDIVTCVLGIVSLILLNNPEAEGHYRRRGY